MPFAVADLAPLLYALITLALACATGLLVKIVAQMIPNLPVIGSALRDAVNDAGGTVYQFLIGQAHGSWTVAHDILTDVVWADKWLANYTVKCISHLGDQASHIWSGLEGSVSNIEATFANLTTVVIPRDISSAVSIVDNRITSTATSLQNNIDHVIDTTIPQAIAGEVTRVDTEIGHIATSLQNNISSLATDVTNDLSQVWSSINPLQIAVSTTLPGLIEQEAQTQAAATTAVATTAQANLVTATQNLQTNLNQVQTGLQNSIAAASAAAAALAAADLTTAEGVATATAAQATITAENVSQTALTFQAEALQGQIDQNRQAIDTLQATETISLPQVYGITSPGTIAIPVAVAALATEVVSIASEIESCMITSCDGPNSLVNQLSKLSGLFSTAGELSFLAAAIKDPQGTADGLADIVGSFWSTGESLFDDLLSI